jgi:hypothetical protein
MPSFVITAYRLVLGFLVDSMRLWGSLTELTRIVIALAVCALFITAGARSERTGWSVACFFAAFAAFAYIFDVGIHMMG